MVKSFKILSIIIFMFPIIVWMSIGKNTMLYENKELEETIQQSN